MANADPGMRIPPLLWALFGFRGRLSRRIYWLAYAGIFCLQLALARPIMYGLEAALNGTPEQAPLWPNFVLLATVASHVAISVKRLHDMGYRGFLAIAVLIPLVQVFFTIWAGIVPGSAGANRFGDVVDRRPA